MTDPRIRLRREELEYKLTHEGRLSFYDPRGLHNFWLPPCPAQSTEVGVTALALFISAQVAKQIQETVAKREFNVQLLGSCLRRPESNGPVVIRLYMPELVEMEVETSGITWRERGERQVRGKFEFHENALGMQGFQVSTGRNWLSGEKISSFSDQRETWWWWREIPPRHEREGSDPLNGR